VKADQIYISFIDGSQNKIVEMNLQRAAGAPLYLNVSPTCIDSSLVIVPLSCGLGSKQLALQAEQEIGKML
jgi:hypothetical protein